MINHSRNLNKLFFFNSHSALQERYDSHRELAISSRYKHLMGVGLKILPGQARLVHISSLQRTGFLRLGWNGVY